MNFTLIDHLTSVFTNSIGAPPELGVRAPGRINLIGEHTDYNMGFVMPAAIDKSIYIVARKNYTDTHHWIALDMNESLELSIHQDQKTKYEWADFILGGLLNLKEKGVELGGIDIAFNSDLPIGAGLSSSSALSCGMIFCAAKLFNHPMTMKEVALLGHKSEREFIGLKGGIMDQFASSLGQKDHFLVLDCRSQAMTPVKFPQNDYKLLLINTCVKHSLVSTDYNVRALETAEAAEIISKKYPEVQSLRDVNQEMISACEKELGLIRKKRAQYVVEENQRVENMIQSLNKNDIETAGALLYASHVGLSKDYEVSCDELDFLVDFAKEFDGAIGARMMGGGFGGCTINLIHKDVVDDFKEKIMSAYKAKFNIDPAFIPFELSNGISTMEI